ncbi:RNA polymerase sigma-70 factor [Formosa sp. 3Alg 14/1]|uniref:RNA polymerase sigma-70 factor n=1 Tax=Formosa sp. 3Alg 14/1 TaxID=3382190 RepID=UPI0039BDAE50
MMNNRFNSDAFLLAELQNGSEQAFNFIFRKYYEGLCFKANGYVNDIDKAQSLVQDCFIKLWEKRDNTEKINNLSAYLSFMVRNRCIDYIRKSESIKNLHDSIAPCQDKNDVECTFISEEFETWLMYKITLLPKKSRIAFEYSRFEDLTYNEIALKMNISNKAVEALISRSLRILRKDLQLYLPFLISFLLK